MGKPAEHYFLPTLVPLSLLAALGIERLATHDLPLMRRFALSASQATAALFGTILALSTLTAFVTVHETKVHWGAPALITRSADYLRDRLKGRCLYVFNRLPIYYYLTNACAPTPYVFPNHLNDSAELHALPVDALGEFARVLQAKPVLLVRIPITSETDPAAEEMLNQALTRDYVLDRMFAGDHQTINVYVPRPAK